MFRGILIFLLILILFALVGWPALTIFIHGIDGAIPVWILANSVINCLHLIFWFGGEIITNSSDEPNEKVDAYITFGGTGLFLTSFCSSAYLMELYLINEILIFPMEAAYLIIFAAVMNYSLLILIVTCLISLVNIRYDSDYFKRKIYLRICAAVSLLLFSVLLLNLLTHQSSSECNLVKDFWLRMDIKYPILMGLIIAFIFEGDELTLQKQIMWGIAITGVVVLLITNAYWLFYYGFDLVSERSFGTCGEFMGATAVQLLIEGWFGVLGITIGISVVFLIGTGIVFGICYGVYWILCPGMLSEVFEESEDEVQIELPLIRLEISDFNPRDHTSSFKKEGLCVICLEHFEQGQKVVYWSECRHVFHHKCIEYWTSKNNNTCPICKRVFRNGTASSVNNSASPALAHYNNNENTIPLLQHVPGPTL